jgi:tetratricopeptide (TPR) repeat protein
VHLHLGQALCRRGKLDEAVAACRRAVELNPDQVLQHYWLALAKLAAADLDGYRATCAAMLGQFDGTDRPEAAHWVAWTSALAGDAVGDRDRPVELAAAACRSDPQAERHAVCLGAALYRAGRFGEAIACLNEARAQAQRAASPATSSSPAYPCFFLALAHHRLGQGRQAREWLAEAVRRTEQETQNDRIRWNRRATLQLLRREAEAVVTGQTE